MSARVSSGATPSAATRLTVVNLALGVGLAAALASAYWLSDSQLALASMVDSIVDTVVAGALVWALRIADRPADADHPAGHQAAEPIAALVVAVLAGVMGVEVVRSAVESLLSRDTPQLVAAVAWTLGTKAGLKAVIAVWCWQLVRRTGPAVRALYIDARNDVATGALALAGYGLARYGWPGWDAWLAVPIGAWIVVSGFELARDNMRLLMGEVADEARHRELSAIASGVADVYSVHELIARHHGTHLDVSLHVVVDPQLPLRDAHEIGQRVYVRLMQEPDVAAANVHLDVE